MILPHALNLFLGPLLIIIIIIAECSSKFRGSVFRKKIFCVFLYIALLLLIADFILYLLYSAEYIRFYWSVITMLLLYIYLFIILNKIKVDNLTGLNNRNSFFEYIKKLPRDKDPCILVMIEFYNFKSINNSYGYLEGDSALCVLAQIIQRCIRKTDFVARYSGDEFVLVIKESNRTDDVVNRIFNELEYYNENSGKSYNIEINYNAGIFSADKSNYVEDMLNNLNRLIKEKSEENRRIGDYKK